MASDTSHNPLRCVALRKDGKPCQAFASTPDGRCIMHSARAPLLHIAGGRASSKASRAEKLMPARLLPIVEKLEAVFAEVYAGATEKRVNEARAMATIAIAIGKLIQVGELEERTRALERAAQDQGLYGKRAR